MIFENIIATIWNHIFRGARRKRPEAGLTLGVRVSDSEVTRERVVIPHERRAQHIVVLGKTGTGKSYFLRSLCRQDVIAGRGFVFFDLHGDATPFLLGCIVEEERKTGRDLSGRTIVIEPSDLDYSVGLNPLEGGALGHRFVQIAEFAEVLKRRWRLDSFGARTDELLRNALYVLAENNLTLVELATFLSNTGFRARCLQHVSNVEVRQYFDERFEQASEPMRAVMREPILNKISTFTADPHFRHIVGQRESTFSVREAMDGGSWIILNLHKGKLGEQAATLGSLFLATIKNALFTREKRRLFTLYCDEIQNLVAYGSGLETILSEARKFGVSVVSANQFLDQYPQETRAALEAVGSHIYFQLSTADATHTAQALDGGKPLAERLKNLPQRHLIAKIGSDRITEVLVPAVPEGNSSFADLYERCRSRWARKRTEVEAEIASRLGSAAKSTREVLNDWE